MPDADLTARARIRNIALEMFGRYGFERVSMRAVAEAAGCTVGLVQHHFGSKDGLRVAVEDEIFDYLTTALAGGPGDVAARDARVHAMLAFHPEVTDYLRRALLDRPGESGMLSRIVALSRAEVATMRKSGTIKATRSEQEQVVHLLVRQFGVLFLDPMVAAVWEEMEQPADSRPELRVTLK